MSFLPFRKVLYEISDLTGSSKATTMSLWEFGRAQYHDTSGYAVDWDSCIPSWNAWNPVSASLPLIQLPVKPERCWEVAGGGWWLSPCHLSGHPDGLWPGPSLVCCRHLGRPFPLLCLSHKQNLYCMRAVIGLAASNWRYRQPTSQSHFPNCSRESHCYLDPHPALDA